MHNLWRDDFWCGIMFGGIREVVKEEGGLGRKQTTKEEEEHKDLQGHRRMILPFAKLGALMIKTLGKPLATRMKVEAAKHPWFRQLIINFAQVKTLLVHLVKLGKR